MSRPRFIFTLTTGHSGGTLLNLLLGASPAVFAAGESLRVGHLRKLDAQPEATRAFWGAAVERLAERGWPTEGLDQAFADQAPIAFWRDWVEIIADQSAEPVIADKSLSFAVIRRICEAGLVDPFFVHLVRDPRAVSYSFFKKYSSDWRQALSWTRSHRAIEAFLAARSNARRVRYEDLVVDPWPHLRGVLEAAGAHFDLDLASGVPADIGERSLDDPIFENRIFAGNRMRHDENRSGRGIAADGAFLSDLPARDWALATALCFPWMGRYGYALTRRGAQAQAAARSGHAAGAV